MSLLGVWVPGASVCSEGETSQRASGAVRTKVKDRPSWRKVSEWICWIFEVTYAETSEHLRLVSNRYLMHSNFAPNYWNRRLCLLSRVMHGMSVTDGGTNRAHTLAFQL